MRETLLLFALFGVTLSDDTHSDKLAPWCKACFARSNAENKQRRREAGAGEEKVEEGGEEGDEVEGEEGEGEGEVEAEEEEEPGGEVPVSSSEEATLRNQARRDSGRKCTQKFCTGYPCACLASTFTVRSTYFFFSIKVLRRQEAGCIPWEKAWGARTQSTVQSVQRRWQG
jgi:hypothetical protein